MKFSSGPDLSLQVENRQLREKVAELEKHQVKKLPKQSPLLCQKNINLPNGTTTYCMRPMNHSLYDLKGKCDISPKEIDKND